MGCYIFRLEDICMITAKGLKAEYDQDYEGEDNIPEFKETDDYLEIGGEAVSVDLFTLKVKDFHEENPPLYGRGDSYHMVENGYIYCTNDYWPTLKIFFGLIAYSITEITGY